MKTLLFAAVFSASLISLCASAQTPPPPESERGPGPRPERGLRADEGLHAISTIQGKLAMFTINDDQVYDGFVLLNGADSIRVNFPPHMGKQITNAVKVGSTLSVSGSLHTNPEGKKAIHFISLSANGQTIMDTQPPVGSVPAVEATVSGSGKLASLQTDREGRVSGLLLEGNTLLRMPPHVADQLNGMVKTGATIGYTGNKKSAKDGEVSNGNYTIVHTQTITVNGQQYLVR